MIKTKSIDEICGGMLNSNQDKTRPAVQSGIEELDKYVNIKNGDFAVISAVPGIGRTALLLAFMNNAIDNDKSVDLILLNDRFDNLIWRIISSRTGVSLKKIGVGEDSLTEEAKAELECLKSKKIRVIEGVFTDAELIDFVENDGSRDLLLISGLEAILESSVFNNYTTYEEIEKVFRKEKNGKTIDTFHENDEIAINPYSGMTSFVETVKGISRKNGFATIGTVEHSRLPIYRRDLHHPHIEDLRKYGRLADAVDYVMLPHRPYYYWSPDDAIIRGYDSPEEYEYYTSIRKDASIYVSKKETRPVLARALWDENLACFKSWNYDDSQPQYMIDEMKYYDDEMAELDGETKEGRCNDSIY